MRHYNNTTSTISPLRLFVLIKSWTGGLGGYKILYIYTFIVGSELAACMTTKTKPPPKKERCIGKE